MNKLSYIDIMFGGICKGCRHADLELESAESYFGEKFWALRCVHARACEAAREKALREAGEKDGGGLEDETRRAD